MTPRWRQRKISNLSPLGRKSGYLVLGGHLSGARVGIIDHLATVGPYSTYAYVKLTWNRQLTTLNSRPESLRERVEFIHHRGIAEPIFMNNLFPRADGDRKGSPLAMSKASAMNKKKKCGLLVQGPIQKSRVPMKQRLLTEG